MLALCSVLMPPKLVPIILKLCQHNWSKPTYVYTMCSHTVAIRSIRRRSRIVAASLKVLSEIVAALEQQPCHTYYSRSTQHVDMPCDSFSIAGARKVTINTWQSSKTSSNLLRQQRGQNHLVQWCQSTVSLRIASLAASKHRSRINAAQTRAMKQIVATASDRMNMVLTMLQ